jgi:Flp pilus assembly protein TadD
VPARIAIAALAIVIAAAMAVQLRANHLQTSAVKEIGRGANGVKDRNANRHALDNAQRVADLRPGSGALFTAIGLQVRAKKLAQAEQTALRATKREPDNFATWLTLGVVRQSRGDDKGAALAFARVKKLNPLYRLPSL